MFPMIDINNKKTLEETIQSVLSQTYKNFEIIIIDNHSDDNTQEVVKSFKSNKIIYERIYNQGIIGKSRNLGLRISKGKYVSLCRKSK